MIIVMVEATLTNKDTLIMSNKLHTVTICIEDQ